MDSAQMLATALSARTASRGPTLVHVSYSTVQRRPHARTQRTLVTARLLDAPRFPAGRAPQLQRNSRRHGCTTTKHASPRRTLSSAMAHARCTASGCNPADARLAGHTHLRAVFLVIISWFGIRSFDDEQQIS